MGEVDHLLAPHQLEQLHRRHVDRLLERPPQGHDAVMLVVVVLGAVAELAVGADERGRRVEQRVGRGPPRLQGGAVDERLERRPHLPVRLGDAIEAVAVEVPAADQAAHGAGLVLDHHRRRLDHRLLLEVEAGLGHRLRRLGRGQWLRGGSRLRRRRLALRIGEAEPGDRAALQQVARIAAVGPGDPLGAEGVGRLADLHLGALRSGREHQTLVPAADHRLAAPPGGERLGVDLPFLELGDRAAPAAPVVELQQTGVDGVLGRLLDLRIERGLHLEPPLVEGGGAVIGLQILAGLLGEVGGEHLLGLLGDDLDRLRHRLIVVGLGDEALLEHPAQHAVALLLHGLGGAVRAVAAGRRDDAGEHRRLGEGELHGRLVEVVAGGRLHPVVAVAEVDQVQAYRVRICGLL